MTEQLEEALAPETPFERMKPGTANEDGTWNLTYEPVPLRTVDLAARMESRLPKELPQTGNQGITLRDVADGEADLETFLSQLSDEDLKAIVRGEGMSSPKVTPGTAAAFGKQAQRRTVTAVMIIYLAAACLFLILLDPVFVTAAVVEALVWMYYRRMSEKYFGGITGDLAGWFVSVGEAAGMIWLALCGLGMEKFL